MMCSFFSPRKTAQDITQEIINILNMCEYPVIPFLLSGKQGIMLKEFGELQNVIFFLQERIDLWYLKRKFRNWKMRNEELSQEVLLCLKSARIKKHPLFNSFGDLVLSENYYEDRLRSYVINIKMIIIVLIKWSYFLFTQESKRYGLRKVHFSLKELFCQGIR